MTATESTNVQNIANATEGDVQIGQTYSVRRPDGTLHEATIIQTRETEDKTKEFYVHYSGLNRRLDQWVTIDQILPANTVNCITGEENSELKFSTCNQNNGFK